MSSARLAGVLALAALGACADPAGDSANAPVEEGVEPLPLGDVQVCDTPVPLGYTEVGEALGLEGGPDPLATHHHGGSLAVADLDADGDRDIVLGWTQSPPRLWRNEGGRFVAEELPGPDGTFLLHLADLDADGRLDLLVGGFKVDPQVLVQTDAGFVAWPLFDLPPQARRARELSAGDIDGDGLLEVYAVTNAGSDSDTDRTDFVLRNEGDGLRYDPAAEVSVGRGFDAVWADADADGDPDVYVVNDVGADYGPNRLLLNDGGQLVASEGCTCEIVHFGMGGDAADLNHDGLPDFFLTGVGVNALLESQADGTWVDTIRARAANSLQESLHMGWGAVWLDHDNDGRLDILVAQGDRWVQDDEEASYDIVYDAPIDLLAGQPDGSFVQVGPALGLATSGSHRSAVADDLNGDGVLDLVVTDVVARPRVYLSDGCTDAGWLRVEAPPHTRVTWEHDGVSHTGWVTAESGYGASHAPFLHIGLGSAPDVAALRLDLPDGRIYAGTNVAGRRTLTVR